MKDKELNKFIEGYVEQVMATKSELKTYNILADFYMECYRQGHEDANNIFKKLLGGEAS
jgi:hypothetical protein